MAPIRRRKRAPIRRRKRRNHNQQISTIKISDINDYCLLNILKHLTPLDMCAVKDTCHRFRGLAEKHMKLYYSTEALVISDRTRNESDNVYNRMKIFTKFCGVFRMLDISILDVCWHEENDSDVFTKIRKCEPKLDSLALTGKNFALALSRLPKTLRNLKKIRLEYFDAVAFECDIRREDILKDLLKKCTNVEEIYFGARVNVLGCRYQATFLNQKFKHLRSLELFEVRDIDLNNLNLFLKLNPNIQRITLKQCVRLRDLTYVNFARNAPNIQGIAISFNKLDHLENRYTPLRQANAYALLDKLKCLSFDTCETRITDLIISLGKKNSLIYLTLTHVFEKVNEGLGEAFCNMKNLKILRLNITYYNLHNTHFKEFYKVLSSNLVNLVELHLLQSQVTFQQICDIVKNSFSLQKLYLPHMSHIYGGDLNEENYVILVEKQYSKSTNSQLTIFLDSATYEMATRFIPSVILQANSNAIKLSEFIPSHYDDYWLPDSI